MTVDDHMSCEETRSATPEPFERSRMYWRRLLLFVVAAAVIILANLAPGSWQPGTSNDKLNHMLAFAVLTPLALISFPSTSVVRIFFGLAFFNAGIELSQAALSLGREPDPLDWLAGTLATIPVLAAVGGYRLFFLAK